MLLLAHHFFLFIFRVIDPIPIPSHALSSISIHHSLDVYVLYTLPSPLNPANTELMETVDNCYCQLSITGNLIVLLSKYTIFFKILIIWGTLKSRNDKSQIAPFLFVLALGVGVIPYVNWTRISSLYRIMLFLCNSLYSKLWILTMKWNSAL